MTAPLRALAAALLAVALSLGVVPGPLAAPQVQAQSAVADPAAWETVAAAAEQAVASDATPDAVLERLRGQIADWRAAHLSAQNANSARIATLRQQIDALGPAPAEGQTEAPEIAQRRTELTDQLARLQAPGLAAEEAYRRADGLIREIDRVLRERQADQLLRLWPSPVNPANWPAGLAALTDAGARLWSETGSRWRLTEARRTLWGNLPLIGLLMLGGLGLIWRGRPTIEGWSQRLSEQASARGRRVWAFLASLGTIVVPVLGTVAFSQALLLTGLLGIDGTQLARRLPGIGFLVFTALWVGGRVFPRGLGDGGPLNLTPERRAEGRLHAASLGLLLGLEALANVVLRPERVSDAALATVSFPVIVLAGLLLLRLGQLLRRAGVDAADEGAGLGPQLLRMVGRAAEAVGLIGPVLAAVGYVAAAEALVYPAIMSLGLMGLLTVLQRLVGDIWGLLSGRGDEGGEALVPTLIGLALVLAALPVMALIWGARVEDLTEVWARFREGFQIGETRVSPMALLFLAATFAAGYGITRLVQGTLRATVLPRTRLDPGGQNAVVVGVGWLGIAISALVAVNAAGIDLSGLAFIAGALSLGLGFGLQNIVSNFVSGVILLIERPVSEGDWIEVGGAQGIVKSISVRSTRIQTFDRTDVIVPNADLISGQVTNWTRFNLSGRLIVPVGVAYGSDTRKVERVLREVAEAQPLAVLNPPPLVVFAGFGADALNFEIRLILRDVNFSLSVRTEINHQIAERFAAEGIEMPFAQRDLWLRNAEEVARAFRSARRATPEEPPA